MDEETLYINKSEEAALEAMEKASSMYPKQVEASDGGEHCAEAPEKEECAKAVSEKELDNDEEETMQACSELAELAIALRMEKGMPALDVEKELTAFRRKHRQERRKTQWAWGVSLLGTAAIIALLFMLHIPADSFQSTREGLLVFQADPSVQQVTLQVSDREEPKPLTDMAKQMPRTGGAQVFPNELNYTTEKIDEAIAQNRVRMHRLHIPRGETFKVVLSDGTEVLLNADSRLAYPAVFKGKERVVSLEGEAYFKVAKDAEHPFIVRSGVLRTRVLGTEFNVRNYDSKNACVTLIQGKVEVSDTCGVQTVAMLPGQSAHFRTDGTFAVHEVDLDPYIYWKEGYFYFDSITLVDMMKEIGRWYNVDVEFRNREAMELRVHFFSDRRQDILHTIELLNRMEKVHALYEEGKVIIE